MRLLLALLVLTGCGSKVVELVMAGEERKLRSRPAGARPSSPEAPPVMVLALDGISRSLLYDMLRAGELPNLTRLLGGDNLAHAHLDETHLATLPTTTMAAWATAFTGVAPAVHGVTGNEYFIRETATFACPAPVSFKEADPTLSIYTDDYLGKLIDSPTLYERLRATQPDALMWVAMNQVYRGADVLLLPEKEVVAKAFGSIVKLAVEGDKTNLRDVYAALDTGAIESVNDRLRKGVLPDLLTLYLYGMDLYAHVAPEGPDKARRDYLRQVIEPALGKLVARLHQRGLLDRLWVVVISDHGHTAVVHDETRALGSGDRERPVVVLQEAGFRVRAFQREVAANDPSSAVLAYGGAMAYVYLADRSKCPGARDACVWGHPPRYDEDVLVAAEAYHRANRDGAMRGTLDMILVRRPRPVREVDLPFEVYLGDGKTQPVEAYLREHPHPSFVDMPERLRDLAVGVHGERAGDLLLLAHQDEARPADRFYFAGRYHSWHGSPSRSDSEIPLIVAHRGLRAPEIAAWVRAKLGDRPYQQKLTPLVLGLRAGGSQRIVRQLDRVDRELRGTARLQRDGRDRRRIDPERRQR